LVEEGEGGGRNSSFFLWWWKVYKKERDDQKNDEDQSCGMMDKGRDGEKERKEEKFIIISS